MKKIHSIQICEHSNEELLPDFSSGFPYLATCAELDKYIDATVPWHWHRTVELFYMESGTLEYRTPNGTWIFPAGSGGFVNANILHTSKVIPSDTHTIQLLHLFDPDLLSGGKGTLLDYKYILPLTTATNLEMLSLSPDIPQQAAMLQQIRTSFDLDEKAWGYEFQLRQHLTNIWLALLELSHPTENRRAVTTADEQKLKDMMLFIQNHYGETLTVDQIAREALISKRSCFRLFQSILHMTPVEYLTSHRLHKACQMLIESDLPITQIAYLCGLGTSSYFSKLFHAHFQCTPTQYRKTWHDCDIF